jgi:hypothetical protein
VLIITHKLFVASHDEEHIDNVRQMLKAAPKPGVGLQNPTPVMAKNRWALQPNLRTISFMQ